MVSYYMYSNMFLLRIQYSISIFLRRTPPSLFCGIANYIYCWLLQTPLCDQKGRVHKMNRLIKHQISIAFNLAWTPHWYKGQQSQDFKANRSYFLVKLRKKNPSVMHQNTKPWWWFMLTGWKKAGSQPVTPFHLRGNNYQLLLRSWIAGTGSEVLAGLFKLWLRPKVPWKQWVYLRSCCNHSCVADSWSRYMPWVLLAAHWVGTHKAL